RPPNRWKRGASLRSALRTRSCGRAPRCSPSGSPHARSRSSHRARRPPAGSSPARRATPPTRRRRTPTPRRRRSTPSIRSLPCSSPSVAYRRVALVPTFQRTLHLPLAIAICDVPALVALLLAAGDRELHLHAAVLEVEPRGDDRQALLAH